MTNPAPLLSGNDAHLLPTRQEQLKVLGFDNEDQYAQHQHTLKASRELAEKQLATCFDFYAGYVQLEGAHVKVDFKTSINATEAEKKSAFLKALSEVATLEYLCIGTACED